MRSNLYRSDAIHLDNIPTKCLEGSMCPRSYQHDAAFSNVKNFSTFHKTKERNIKHKT